MSEDNLENLSNKEIRSKCLELGLPNVPVTDSSRKVLIKKIRNSLGGESLASPKKATAQRNESNSQRSLSRNQESIVTNGNRASGVSGPNSRRTTIATLQEMPQTLASAETQQPSSSSAAEKSQAGKIGNRRISQQKAREVEKFTKKTDDVPVVIIESDEEDDELVTAAEKVEKEQLNLPTSNKRPQSLPKSDVTKVTVFTGESAPMRKNFSNENVESLNIFVSTKEAKVLPHVVTQPTSAYTTDAALNYRKKTFGSERPYPMEKLQEQSGYGNKFRQFGTGSFTSDNTSVYTANVQPKFNSKTTNLYYNEFSDNEIGTDFGNATQPPFLSRFAQNLERSRAGSSGRSSVEPSGSTRGEYKYHYANQRRPTTQTGGQKIVKLNRYLFVFVALLVIIFLFILFWQ